MEKTNSIITLEKIKDVLESSNLIKTNNKRYWEFWELINQTEKEIKNIMCEHEKVVFDEVENELLCLNCGEYVNGENIAG